MKVKLIKTRLFTFWKLTSDKELLETTYVKGVLHFIGTMENSSSVMRRVDELLKALETRNKAAIRKALKALLPDYEPNGGLSK